MVIQNTAVTGKWSTDSSSSFPATNASGSAPRQAAAANTSFITLDIFWVGGLCYLLVPFDTLECWSISEIIQSIHTRRFRKTFDIWMGGVGGWVNQINGLYDSLSLSLFFILPFLQNIFLYLYLCLCIVSMYNWLWTSFPSYIIDIIFQPTLISSLTKENLFYTILLMAAGRVAAAQAGQARGHSLPLWSLWLLWQSGPRAQSAHPGS